MPAPVGNKTGTFSLNASCGGVSVALNGQPTGSASPGWSILAPAALTGTITAGTITLGAAATFAGTEKVAVFWTIAGVNYYRYDCTIAAGTAQTAFALSGGTGSALPSSGQAVSLATNQDITDDVSITGNNVQQLLVTSTQIGLVEFNNSTPAQDRLSYIAIANSADAWSTAQGQAAPPTGGAGANWTGTDTVTTIRCWNFGSVAATMQVGFILS